MDVVLGTQRELLREQVTCNVNETLTDLSGAAA